ncbi:Bax inhibitor-1/YccA family protein [Planococcus sp. N028]|uniref:Bax inhibitor-1/YccA family protein n=1 Tax=Planococcus shixiaomingii TaxID=3058393 RepID=A0ABT8N2Z2_9BACL|nr:MULTISPECIES: Bax inhibitor-1/YccA family protein [unclassified Planococcus (in: firmicutes)]MDN7242263.1 Bax inhibitor-1/YccA family protein [Planococcus sp. N028]WKA54516.1 Bax inhibitor-1/YccA family protein [Planococcus sp. N022]
MYSQYELEKEMPNNEMLKSVLSFFSVLWVISGIGVIAGQFVPPALMLPLMVVEVVLLISMIFIRKARKAGSTFAMVFALISGITLYPVLTYYVGSLGGEVVLAVFVSTAVVFAAYGLVGYRLNKNLVGWSSYLFVALIAFFVISLFGFFVPFSSGFAMILSMGGVLLFSLYTIYDFNRIRHQPMSQEDVPFVAIGLYLDFLNLFLNILRLTSFLSRD